MRFSVASLLCRLRREARTSHMLGKPSITELCSIQNITILEKSLEAAKTVPHFLSRVSRQRPGQESPHTKKLPDNKICSAGMIHSWESAEVGSPCKWPVR